DPPACVERHGPSTWSYTILPPGVPPVGPGDPAYRGTADVVKVSYNGLGIPILQITQAFPAVMVTDSAFARGDRVYINMCAGMVEVNQGEFFIAPVTDASSIAHFVGYINTPGSGTVAGLVLTVSSVTDGTI